MQVFGRKTALATRGEFPFQLPALRIHGVEVAVIAAEVHISKRHCWRRGDATVSLEFPLEHAGHCVERVDVGVAGAEVDNAVGDDGRREKKVEGIGHGFDGGFRAVKMLCGEAPFTFRFEFPF